jgi:uncharacterized protein (TIGR00251 family)
MKASSLMTSTFCATEDGTAVEIFVQPRAGKNEFAGIHDGRLKVRLTAPPVEGEANKECVRFLAKALHIPKSAVIILAGHKTRRKTLLIRGLPPEEVTRILGVIPE